MDFKSEIEWTFGGQAFLRPLYHSFKNGLRFELSEGDDYLHRFLSAHRKGSEICDRVFRDSSNLVVCFKLYGARLLLASIHVFRELRKAQIRIPRIRQAWFEPDDASDSECGWWYIAFESPKALLPGLLWCAFAVDFGAIRPNPGLDIYLFNFEKSVLVLPYDDRGMDVVGPNHDFLRELYFECNSYLCEYDRGEMKSVFG